MKIFSIFLKVTFSSPLSILIIAFHTVFIIAFINKELLFELSMSEIFIYWTVSCLLSLLTLNWLRIPLSQSKSQRLTVLILLSFVLVESFLLVAHYITGAPMDFALIYYNFNEIFVREALVSIFLSGQFRIGMLFLCFLGISLWIMHRKFLLFSLEPVSRTTTVMFINAFFFFSILPFTSDYSAGMAFLGKSGYMTMTSHSDSAEISISDQNEVIKADRPATDPTAQTETSSSNEPETSPHVRTEINHSDQPEIRKNSKFPYVNFRPHSSSVSLQNKPHVFIIVVESFNAGFVEAKTQNGKSYTPFFDALISRGTYFENFFSNSIQTSRSQFSILCGVPPSYKAKIFTHHTSLNLSCLPKILDQEGYTSLFFKAYRSLEFDNTDEFTREIGFNHRHSMDAEFIKNEDKPFIWGWGLQDNIFYQKYFSFLDELNEQQPDQVFFSMLTTVTNHMMFDKIPRNQRYLYKSPRNVKENYANSIYLSDRYLREFFKQLQSRSYLSNSIVIITGDNSYPVGEHGYISNEASYYNEFFKTPLLIVYTEDKESHRIEKAFSHVDIAPTLLEILDIETKHHFIGSSVLTGIKTDDLNTTQAEDSRSIYISQPHSGTFLGTIKYPYKYVQHEISGREFLYNIESDPEERTNLIKVQTLDKVIQKLQQANKFHYFNQRIIEENRIWPGNDQSIDPIATDQSDIVFLE